MPWLVDWDIVFNGSALNASARPFLINISVTDKDGLTSDSCSLTFDDNDGQIRLPEKTATLQVFLQGVQVFSGVVDGVRSKGSRARGRTIQIQGNGFDSAGKVKQLQRFHKDNTSLKAFLSQAAINAGFTLKIDPDLGDITRDYWVADGESFLHLGQRLAGELGATFKLRGQMAVFKQRGKAVKLPTIEGRVGGKSQGNVISWSIAPFVGREKYTKVKARYFDRKSGTYQFREIEIAQTPEDQADETIDDSRQLAGDENQAMAITKARAAKCAREKGGGTVQLDLTPQAQAEAHFILTGARAGIDGAYRIVCVTHKASKLGGAITTLQLKQPQNTVGHDDRKSDRPDQPKKGSPKRPAN